MLRRSLALPAALLTACAAEAPAPPKAPEATLAATTATPSVPPGPVVGTEAFYIVAIPAPARPMGATICASDAACDALLPPNPPYIVRRFGVESWVVIAKPADLSVENVVSDGTTATVVLAASCAGASQVVLYRVAPSVTKVEVRPPPASSSCAKAP